MLRTHFFLGLIILLAIPSALSQPDLYVESLGFSPDPPRTSYEATLTVSVKNVGQDVVPSGFQGQFSINGLDHGAQVQFQQGLQPGSRVTKQVPWFPQQPGSYTIGFFVDPGQVVTESDESGESNYEEIQVNVVTQNPDIVVTDIEWYPEDPEAGEEVTLRATIENDGMAPLVGAFWVEFQVNGNPLPGPPQEIWGPIPVGETRAVSTSWTPSVAGDYTVRFQADTLDYITEMDEGNNDRVESIRVNPDEDLPDLVPTSHNATPLYSILGTRVTFDPPIRNFGDAPTSGPFLVRLVTPDGNLDHQITGNIPAGGWTNSHHNWTPASPGNFTVQIIVDVSNQITEGNESNNQLTQDMVVYSPTALPDLFITDIWHEGAEIKCQVQNLGNATAPAGIRIALLIDGNSRDFQPLPSELPPLSRQYITFTHQWGCGAGSLEVGACADMSSMLPEFDEDNNCRLETWKCDDTPPLIIWGPRSSATSNSAIITWNTDEPSDSTVFIDGKKPVMSRSVSDDKPVTQHSIRVDGLSPFRVYAFYVESEDASKNRATSKTYTLFTDPEPDDGDPEVEISGGAVAMGTSMFSADASDDKGVRRVDFFIDGEFFCSDYSHPYEFPVDTSGLINGMHTVTATVFDFVGNSHSDEMGFDVENLLPDMDAPSIGVYSPRRDETIAGDYLVNITAYDAEGMHTVEVYMDGERIYSVSAPNVLFSTVLMGRGLTPISMKEDLTRTYPRLNISFLMDTLDWDNGDYNFTVTGWDLGGNRTTHYIPITIFNPFPRNHPNLVVTRPDTRFTFSPPGLLVKLRVENTGTRSAQGIVVQDYLHGFYPTGVSSPLGVQVEGRLGLMGGVYTTAYSMAEITVPDLEPGEAITVSYRVVPYLNEFFPQHRSIGGSTRVDYGGTQGDSYGEFIGVPCSTVRIDLGSGISMSSDLNAFVGALIMELDYIIVTCPANMPILGTDEEVGGLVTSMARLAHARDGVLGFLEPAPADVLRERLCELTWDGGGWSEQLHPDYPTRGYLLIVGETEIIPSWYHGPFNIRWSGSGRKDVEYCDTDYGDSNGNWKPEIIVGRIIGNTAVQLQASIDASISVAEGASTFDRSKVLLISGEGAHFMTFVNDIDDVEGDLSGEYAFVDKIHMKDFFIIDDFHHGYTRHDGLAVGDVMGGSDKEIILARDDDEKVFVYSRSGTLLGEYSLPGFDDDCIFRINERAGVDYISFFDPGSDRVETSKVDGLNHGASQLTEFTGYYDFDVGSVDSDSGNEYVIASAEDDRIYIHDSSGSSSFAFDFTNHDRMRVGDVAGDYRDEIIIARNDDNSIFVYDGTGTLLGAFTSSDEIFTRYDRLAIGDVLGNSKEEILIARDDDKTVHAYSSAGVHLGEVYLWFTRYDDIAVGDIMGDSKCEIVMAKDDDTQIYIADFNWEDRIIYDMRTSMTNSDVIHWFGHSNIDNWGCFSTVDVPGGFGGAVPFVFTVTCLAGNYENGDDSNIAERFLENGAAVYIGSTMVSPNQLNDYASNKLFDNWIDTDRTLGEAFKETEKDVRNRYTNYEWGSFGKFWVAEYNYYGDPKFGSFGGISSPAELGDNPEPTTQLTVDIPDLVISSEGENDTVNLPGGIPNTRSGYPQVPAFSTSLPVPSGWRVVNLSLVSTAQPETYEDLNIPPAEVFIDGGGLGTLASYGEGWYPDTDFDWEVLEEEGTQELVITVFPAAYNALIAQLRFTDRYDFHIHYAQSQLDLVDAYMESFTFAPGEEMNVEVEIENRSGEDVWAILEGTIRSCIGGDPIDGILLNQIDIKGRTLVSVNWSVGQVEDGGYALDLVLRDEMDNPVGSRTLRFWVSRSSLNITSMSIEPGSACPGGSVDVSVSLQNAGSSTVDGKEWFWVYDSEGKRVFESAGNITDIPPNTVTSFSRSIDLSGMHTGKYDVGYFAILNGQVLESRFASFSVGEMPPLLLLMVLFASLVTRRHR